MSNGISMILKIKSKSLIGVWSCAVAFFMLFFTGALYAFTGETVSPAVERNIAATAVASAQEADGSSLMEEESKWRVLPGLAFNTSYDSNINREPGGERNEDIFFETRPSLRVKREGGVVKLDTKYDAGYERYVRDEQTPNIFSQKADLDLQVKFSRLKFLLDETFLRNKTYASSEQSERRTINVNRLGGEVVYDLTDRTAIALRVGNDLFRYGETVVKDSSYLTNRYGGRLYYKWTERFEIFSDTSYFENRYYRSTSEKNSKGYWTGLGIRGALTPRMAVNLSGGFKHRKYSSEDYNSDSNLYLEGGLKYRMTSRIDALLLLKRDLQESLSTTSSAYRANRSGVDFKYAATEFISFNLGGYVQRNDYLNTNTFSGRKAGDRKDWITGGSAGVEWQFIKNIFWSLRYEYALRSSTDDDQNGYNRHLLTAGIAYKIRD